MNRKYNLKLDLQFRCNNSIMKFNQFDNNTSDFFMKISSGGKSFDVEKAIVVLATIKPSGKVASQFVEIENGLVYADLKPNMVDEIGIYTAQAMLILEDERVVTDVISYEVEEDKIFSLLNDTVGTSEEFTLLTDMLSRLSTIEISEEQRVINEAERILSEENRKTEEAKRVEAELIRQHEEADRTKYDAIRESNENIRKQNESIRLANETNRIDEETKRVDEENKRKLAEEERKANYDFMTEDEERRRVEANAHKEAEKLRAQAETNRVNEEAKRRTTEQARILAENTRVSNENTRKTNETTRQTNETHRVEAETQRQNRYNSFIADAEINANNFENYTNSAKIKEEERKSNELNRKSQEDRRVSNEVERISNENTRKANEVAREKNETSRQYVFENKVNEVDKKIVELNTTKDNFVSNINTKVDTKISEIDNVKDNFVSSISTKVDNKISELDSAKSDMTNTVSNKVNEVENRFNALTSKQQQDAEVIDARDGEISLKARLDRDIEKAKQVYVDVEGSHISSDSSVGYAKDVEILGNTVQSASNLADIRSVGDKVEGQELYEIPVLSCGKNLFNIIEEPIRNIANINLISYDVNSIVASLNENNNWSYIKVPLTNLKPNTDYVFSYTISTNRYARVYQGNTAIDNMISGTDATKRKFNTGNYADLSIRFFITTDNGENGEVTFSNIQIEEGTVATPYEPYQEDKLTILSPVQLEKVGDVADRIIERNGVWGVEKNIGKLPLTSNLGWYSYNSATQSFKIPFTEHQSSYSDSSKLMCNALVSCMGAWEITTEYISSDSQGILVKLGSDKNPTQDLTGLKLYLDTNNVFVLYQRVTPQFIPLPHSQQVKLRTFANKTNISFLTEIEGTIKAQVPKSLGATVNTHTEQINNLNKELDRVKKLEESTVSTVTTESDFTTVEATSNGYFEDVKLEGKTLVNLATQPTNNGSINHQYATISTVTNIKPSTEYTYIIRNNGSETLKLYLNNNGGFDWFDLDVEANSTVIGKARTLPTIDGDIWLSLSEAETIEQNLQVVLLEGDHTQNPPSYFEGLKSVGQSATTSEDGVDEIVVGSSNSYLSNNIPIVRGGKCSGDVYIFDNIVNIDNNRINFENITNVEVGKEYTLAFDFYNKTNDNIYATHGYDITSNVWVNHTVSANSKTRITITFTCVNKYGHRLFIGSSSVGSSYEVSNIVLSKGISYTPYQSDKKRLLYYNTETQAWEKPILRQWDSIEKHANGKYYYHQRSVEEGYTKGDESVSDYITDMTTTVKPLAQEKVYECTNIDLITYANETNYVVESGAIVPRTTLKVHNNISNVVSLLQKKVSLLESNVKASQEVQDMMILETDMRMLDIELALMEFVPMTLNLGGSNMLRSATYFNFLKNHIINETYEKEYLENVMNKYLATGRINQDEYNELYKMLYPPVYDIELPIEY